jgi:hypothetical protein
MGERGTQMKKDKYQIDGHYSASEEKLVLKVGTIESLENTQRNEFKI